MMILYVKSNSLVYCISKAAVNQLTKSAVLHLASKAIRVNAINPVVIRAPLFEARFGLTLEQSAAYVDSFQTIYHQQLNF